jgi:hypothetical protein
MTLSRIAIFTVASAIGFGALVSTSHDASAGMFMDAAKATAHRVAERAVDRAFERLEQKLAKHGMVVQAPKQTPGKLEGQQGSPSTPSTEMAEAPTQTPGNAEEQQGAPSTPPTEVTGAPAQTPANLRAKRIARSH